MKKMRKMLLFIFVELSVIPLVVWFLLKSKDQGALLCTCSTLMAIMCIDNWTGYSFAKLVFTAVFFALFVAISCLVGFVLLPKLVLGYSLLENIWEGVIIGYFPAFFITILGSLTRRKLSKATNSEDNRKQ
jgi:hypothetical protein